MEAIGVGIPELLLPNLNINMKKWSVIACDQFTSQTDYWQQVEKTVGNAPSILHIILPEAHLNYEGLPDNIQIINNVMHDYLSKGVLEQLPRGVMLVERMFGDRIRKGLVLMADLECYDYVPVKKPLIRATEKTLLERIPPRVTIRQDAPLETSHVLLLMDDPGDTVIGPIYKKKDELEKLYDFDLMMGGGRICGYFTEMPALLESLQDSIAKLPVRDGMRFCVGDGNHSLAAAKTVWDMTKENLSQEERENHPLRFAMCELVNIHDDGIEFMPIHRVLFKVNQAAFLQFLVDRLNRKGARAKLIFGRWRGGQEAQKRNELPFLYRDGAGKIVLENMTHSLLLAEVQDILDEFMNDHTSASIDYIHGQEAFEELSRQYDNLGLYFGTIPKDKFFEMVSASGVLPKKSFSMGEAEQKRYYTECRLLTLRKKEDEQPPEGPEAALQEQSAQPEVPQPAEMDEKESEE